MENLRSDGKSVIMDGIMKRLCATCSKEIPAARLKAKPNIHLCVECLSNQGDVPLLHRFDEHIGGNVVDTLYTTNQAFDNQIKRERTHRVSSKVMAESTESEVIVSHPAEINADTRSNNTAFSILSSQGEPDEETV